MSRIDDILEFNEGLETQWSVRKNKQTLAGGEE